MPAERIGMRDAREIIRLKFSSVSTHEIARRLNMARSTVRKTLKRADSAGLSWPFPESMNDEALEAALYASRRSKRGHRRIEEPDWAGVRRELKRKHVTLMILWDEYLAANPGGYSYSRFCELYRSFEKTLSVTMRQTHAAGERLSKMEGRVLPHPQPRPDCSQDSRQRRRDLCDGWLRSARVLL